MKQRGMMLMVVLGLIPFLMAFRFGGEISYPDPTKFQVNSNGFALMTDVAAGDVDGDGDQDLIVLYRLSTATEKRNEVRLYLNQNAELGGPGPTALGGTPSGTVQAINTLFSNSNTNATGNMYVIYQDGWSGTQGTDPSFGRTSGNRVTGWDATADFRSYFTNLAVAYKPHPTVSGRTVVDYILVSREYGTVTTSYYSPWTGYTPRQYAGRIIHLKNPYPGASPNGPWLNKGGTAIHTGNAMNFDATTPDPDHDSTPATAQFFNDDYTWKVPYSSDDVARGTFNSIELADIDGDGDYDLYSAPLVYVNATLSGDNIPAARAANIYRYVNDGTNNFNTAYNDASPAANYIWSDGSTNPIGSQFGQFRLVDMNKDGIPDLLGAQGGGSSYSLSWISGIRGGGNTGKFQNINCKAPGALLNSAGTLVDINAGNLRAPTTGADGDNNNGYPDMVLTRAADAQIEISMYSDKNESAPAWGTFADFQAIYTAPVSETTDSGNTWMYNIKFGRVIVADVDNCGENEIIVTIRGRTGQYWIFKKNTTEYLTMNFNELP
jgi:hypothetical protein